MKLLLQYFCISYILWLGSLIIIYILWIFTIKEAWFITEATLLIIFFFCMFLIYENRNLYFSVYINWKSQQVFSFPLFLKLFLTWIWKNLQRISSIGSSLKCSLMDTMWCSSSKLSMSLLAFRKIILKKWNVHKIFHFFLFW